MIVICSGGQTGVDRGGLDAARSVGVLHRGWCPQGRRAEDGVIPPEYNMQETPSSGYPMRTEMNVVDSQATLIISKDRNLRTGSKLTADFCHQHGRPWIALQPFTDDTVVVKAVLAFLQENKVAVLNVAGNRESSLPGIQKRVCAIVQEVLLCLLR